MRAATLPRGGRHAVGRELHNSFIHSAHNRIKRPLNRKKKHLGQFISEDLSLIKPGIRLHLATKSPGGSLQASFLVTQIRTERSLSIDGIQSGEIPPPHFPKLSLGKGIMRRWPCLVNYRCCQVTPEDMLLFSQASRSETVN